MKETKEDIIRRIKLVVDTAGLDKLDELLLKSGITYREYRKHHPKTPMTRGLADEIIRGTDEESLTYEQITNMYNVNRRQVYDALHTNKYFTKPETKKDKIINYLQTTNLTPSEIAILTNSDNNYVCRIKRDNNIKRPAGIPSRKRVYLSEDTKKSIRKDRLHLSAKEVASKYNVTVDYVYKLCR